MKTRANVDPAMDLKKEGATPSADLQEKDAAKMPQVGNMPTGMKAAKKVTPGQG